MTFPSDHLTHLSFVLTVANQKKILLEGNRKKNFSSTGQCKGILKFL